MKKTRLLAAAMVVCGMAMAQSLPPRPPSHITTNLDINVTSANHALVADMAMGAAITNTLTINGTTQNLSNSPNFTIANVAYSTNAGNASTVTTLNGAQIAAAGGLTNAAAFDAAGSAAAVASNLTIVGGVASNAQTAAQVQASISSATATGTYYAASMLVGSTTNWTAYVGTNLTLFVVSPLVTTSATTAVVGPTTLTHIGSGAHLTAYSTSTYSIPGGSDTTFVWTATSGTITLDRSGAIGSGLWEVYWSSDPSHADTQAGYPNLPLTFNGSTYFSGSATFNWQTTTNAIGTTNTYILASQGWVQSQNYQTAAQVQTAIAPVGLLATNAQTAAQVQASISSATATGTYYAASMLVGSTTNWTAYVGTNLTLFVVSPLVTTSATTAVVGPTTLTHIGSGAHLTAYSTSTYSIPGGSDTTFVWTATSGTITLDRSGAIGSGLWEVYWSSDPSHADTQAGYPNLPLTFNGSTYFSGSATFNWQTTTNAIGTTNTYILASQGWVQSQNYQTAAQVQTAIAPVGLLATNAQTAAQAGTIATNTVNSLASGLSVSKATTVTGAQSNLIASALQGNQTITVSGDATGSGTPAIALTVTNVGATAKIGGTTASTVVSGAASGATALQPNAVNGTDPVGTTVANGLVTTVGSSTPWTGLGYVTKTVTNGLLAANGNGSGLTGITAGQVSGALTNINVNGTLGTVASGVASVTIAAGIADASAGAGMCMRTNGAWVSVFTNSTQLRDGLINGTNGVYFTSKTGTNYWLLTP